MESKLSRITAYAVIAASALYLNSCSAFNAKSEQDICMDYVRRLNTQLNQEGKTWKKSFSDMNYSCDFPKDKKR